MADSIQGFVVPTDEGTIWNMAPGRAASLKAQGTETGESMMVFEELAPPGTETQFHLHHESDEAMFVLSGEFTFKIGDDISKGGPGTYAFMPRGQPHAWKNTGTEPGRVLIIYTPAAAGKMFETMSRSGKAFSSMTPDEIEAVFKEHGWQIVGPAPF